MQLLKPEVSLAPKVARGGFWLLSLRVMEKALGLVRLVILARLLAPNDFGHLGIALLTISTLETFSQTGFQAALIQKKGKVDDYLDTAWTVSVFRGIFLFTILFLSAPYLVIFFDSPTPALFIQVIGIQILFQGFTNIGIVYFQKELEFNKLAVYRLCSTLAYFIISVTAAIILKNVWALVFGVLAEGLTGLITSYLIHPYRPRFSFNLDKIKELFGFGKWVFGSTILIFLITQGDDIFVGKMLGMAALGFYQMAYRISNMPATEITHVISQVTFPAYSKMQDNLPRLRESYLRVLQLTAFLSFPITGLIFILAPDFIEIFLGKKWMPMVPIIQVLVAAGLVRSIAATTGPIFNAVGKPDIDTRWQIVRLSVIVILIYPFTVKWGIVGTSVAVFLSILVSTFGFSFMVERITKCGIWPFCKMIILPLANTMVMIIIVWILKAQFQSIGIWHFFLLSGAGLTCYLSVIIFYEKLLNYGIVKSIRESLAL